jgi:hypothetical protein
MRREPRLDRGALVRVACAAAGAHAAGRSKTLTAHAEGRAPTRGAGRARSRARRAGGRARPHSARTALRAGRTRGYDDHRVLKHFSSDGAREVMRRLWPLRRRRRGPERQRAGCDGGGRGGCTPPAARRAGGAAAGVRNRRPKPCADLAWRGAHLGPAHGQQRAHHARKVHRLQRRHGAATRGAAARARRRLRRAASRRGGAQRLAPRAQHRPRPLRAHAARRPRYAPAGGARAAARVGEGVAASSGRRWSLPRREIVAATRAARRHAGALARCAGRVRCV